MEILEQQVLQVHLGELVLPGLQVTQLLVLLESPVQLDQQDQVIPERQVERDQLGILVMRACKVLQDPQDPELV